MLLVGLLTYLVAAIAVLVVVGRANRIRIASLTIIIAVSFIVTLVVWIVVLSINHDSPSILAPFLMLVVGIPLIVLRKKLNSFANTGIRPPEGPALPDEYPKGPVQDSADSSTSAMIFISYRRHDSGHVTGRIFDRLVQHFGSKAVFKDVDSIPLGVDFRKHLAGSVSQCRLLLAVVGKDWGRKNPIEGETSLDDPRDFVRIEIESALDRQIPVIPILVEGASFPAEVALPPKLQVLTYHNAIVIRPDPDFHSDVARLIKGIEHHLAAQEQRGV